MRAFEGRQIVIATKHEKEKVIGPLITEATGAILLPITDFDTDLFGTFTRDIKRPGDQLTTARKKAQEALKRCGTDLAIASEGSFGMHPSIPFAPSNHELILLVDTKHHIEILGSFVSTETNMNSKTARNIDEVLEFARSFGFPEHGIILRLNKNWNWGIEKEITTENDLKRKAKKLFSIPFIRSIEIETDMRAHKNPTRMRNIETATKNLIENIKKKCPKCQTPGFIVTKTSGNKACEKCKFHTPTPQIATSSCQKCRYEHHEAIGELPFVDPGHCPICNP